MDILKIATAGSVDDGKSTLIGRLLYDTGSVTIDRLEAVESTSKRKGLDFVDLSLLTDGLISEREQGITIDVAHIYFSTNSRKYIIADSPGHFEYTRNMITGASNAEVFIVLIDARNGVIEQTKRHLFIASLLKIGTIFVCINKMDLVAYEEAVFNRIRNEIEHLTTAIGFQGELIFIPIAAKHGENLVSSSHNLGWYQGEPLLSYLESLPVQQKDHTLPARFAVQLIIRPHSETHHDFRGYAGKLLSGTLRKGQAISVLPSKLQGTVKSIWHSQQSVDLAMAGQSLTIELNEDIDVSRGNMIVDNTSPGRQITDISATLCWLNEQPLMLDKNYSLQHGVNIVKAKLVALQHKLDIHSMVEVYQLNELKLNDIARVTIKTAKPVFADSYKVNPKNGAFILVDEFTHNTVAVGFVEE